MVVGRYEIQTVMDAYVCKVHDIEPKHLRGSVSISKESDND